METKVDVELESLNKRLDYSHSLFTYFAAFAGCLLTFLTIWSIIRDQRQHRDYRDERKFYEEHVKNLERTSRERYDKEKSAYDELATAAEERQSEGFKLVAESLRIANQRESTSASAQLENIQKLGGVLQLVKSTFDMQLKREEAQSTLVSKLQQTEEIVEQFQAGYRQQYKEASGHLLELADLKPLEWPTLSDEEQNLATRARTRLESIPPFVLEAEKKKDPALFAKTMQVAGVSAFYSNDIDAAIQRLEEADEAAKLKLSAETTLSRARTKHFLGLAFKNWCVEGTPIGKNVEKAAQYLREAYEATKEDRNEFLTPVTLAEVLSYRVDSQAGAQQLLDELIERLGKLQDASSPGQDERVFLFRCYLLKGNIAYKTGNYQEAMRFNSEALKVSKNNHYALLSVLQSKFALKQPIDPDRWREAIHLLDASGATKKREITTRGAALAWGLVASAIVKDQVGTDRFRKEFDAIGRNTRSIANKFPIFFSPVTKELLAFGDLKQEMNEFIGHL